MRLHTKKKGGSILKFLVICLLAVLTVAGIYTTLVYFENGSPEASVDGSIAYIGKDSSFSIAAADHESGLRSIQLVLKQKDKEHFLINESFKRSGYTGKIGPQTFNKEIDFDLKDSSLVDGDAELILKVSDFSLRGTFAGNTTEIRKDIIIDTKPPKIRLIHAERYISPGGSGLVIYQISGDSTKHGADFGGHFHEGHPIGDGRDDVFVAYIALPYNASETGPSSIIATDAAANSSKIVFSPVFKGWNQKTDTINVGDGFLNEKIPEFETYFPEMQGDHKEKYIYVNTKVRVQNNTMISDLCQNPVAERLWKGKFERMPGASRAGYADHRTYYYKGEEIDRQVHLGMDIASTSRAEVRAANTGRVVYADYLGIYGNMVLLDHGQGVFSLYSHLSQIQVAVGDTINIDTPLGQTGKTGMAGGDHLHFSMLINGIFVTPKEWWDPHWVEVTIDTPLVESKF